MIHAPFITVLYLSTIAIASPANPINLLRPKSNSPPEGVCYPNFEFERVRVANSGINWGAPSFLESVDLAAEGSFDKRLLIRFEQAGSPRPQYVANRHEFIIECKAFCKSATANPPGKLSADGCIVKSAYDNKCVQMGRGPSAGNQGDRIFVNICDGTDSQRFNFITSPFKTSSRATTAKSNIDLAAVGGTRGSDTSTESAMKQVIVNSYIVIGLLGGILLALIVLAIMNARDKGPRSPPRYSFITGSGLKETQALTSPIKRRHSDD
ncbi:hypothetical protein PQX77_011606 [Marasmius sp. AFHP31]|nr:hypothetical protein PQX77_011606 [Marasmius sp. AFHP31]